jgi:3-oxoacyl-[acyl-carrier protein] reductase
VAHRLEGRVALVTGASRGIGRATAQRLAHEGAAVIVNYATHARDAESVVAAIQSTGGRALAAQADVRDRTAVDAMIARAAMELGTPDVLVNNAGALVMGGAVALDEATLIEAVRINVAAAANCVAAALPGMQRLGRGRIINIAATSALATTAAGVAPHAIAKAGVVVYSKQLALELGAQNITVNVVCPGAIDTETTLPGGELHEALKPIRRRQIAHTLLGRTGTAADVAGVIAFLASDDAAFVTAQAISVDGGRTDFLTRSG